jgi:hypothetical protein
MAKKKTTERRVQRDIIKEELVQVFQKKLDDLKEEIEHTIKQRAQYDASRTGKMLDTIIDDEFTKELRGNGGPSIFEKIRKGEATLDEMKEYISLIRGNGQPGLMEQIRKTNKALKITWTCIAFLFLAMLGGERFGIGLKQINNFFLGTKMTERANPDENRRKIVEIDERIVRLEEREGYVEGRIAIIEDKVGCVQKQMENLFNNYYSPVEDYSQDNINKGIGVENEEVKKEYDE